jgi:hypothetical protein
MADVRRQPGDYLRCSDDHDRVENGAAHRSKGVFREDEGEDAVYVLMTIR